ncbi:hypothetical protein P3T76_015293 [Phytophthora citrophthora]|uniref:Helicase-associated domain-containing protein n=1 Tax=Phytophthora citrophthora TaxID=4793 RepID=A0AAD9LAC6_9STRA|nr:hypothetical protein P3T76_015289 [Phytophthora citrophthora]KAK1929165.1 hypothetical protein P3T76_015293 [Phytophthora citrophthora]
MLRLVAARCHLRVRSLQLAPALANGPLHYKDFRRFRLKFSTSVEPTPYHAPSVIQPHNLVVWQKTVNPALRTFLKLNHHLIIPVPFTVPITDGNWPKETWGYPLGKHARRLRQYWKKGTLPNFAIQDLQEMDFAFNPNQYKWDHSVMPALVRYYELYGHSDVPIRYQVKPGDSEWPESLWGFRLGVRVSNIRNMGSFKAQVEKDRKALTQIKFCFDLIDREWNTRVVPSLVVYRQEFGNCEVPRKFTVPNCSPWPEDAAGLRLGEVVQNVRSHNSYSQQRTRDADVLKKLGFVWDFYEAKWNSRILVALQTFKLVEGHCKVPQKFVVPCTKPWPEKSHGLDLGYLVTNIRLQSIHFDQVARNVDGLASIGFEFPITQERWDKRVEPLLATFNELHGHRDVPIDFVVPSEAPWLKMDWGIQLGRLKRKEK